MERGRRPSSLTETPQDTHEILSATMEEIWLRRITALRSVVGIKRSASSRVETQNYPETQKAPEGAFEIHTAFFAALTGRALTIFRAGLALYIIGSPLKGFVPARALVAGFFMTTNLANPGNRKTPVFFSSL